MASWFAFYYIPPAESDFYKLGSEVLGYDVRAQETLEPTHLPDNLKTIPKPWTRSARDFGFHMTVTEALTYDPADLPAIEEEIADILGSFSPDSEMSLTQQGLRIWKEGEVWVLRYTPSRALGILQAVMVARLARFGQTSMFFDEIREHPERYNEPYERKRLKTFLGPRGLDTWQVHFTLLNPHPRETNLELEASFKDLFGDFTSLEPATFSLVVKEGDSPWRIHRDFTWPPEPSTAS